MNKAILIAPIVAVLLVGAISTLTIAAQASIFGSGYDAGYGAFFQGSNDASCPYDFSTYPAWCTGYHAGFGEEQGALRAAQP
ncbi:MAG: hypothetical protein WAZ77_13450 [Candidatus Nitrosopolaris sp.]